MVRITFGGEQMEGFAPKGCCRAHPHKPASNAETGELVLPMMGPDGYGFPENQERPSSLAYTPRRWESGTRELDVDIVIHGEGPGSAWASSVREGDIAVISYLASCLLNVPWSIPASLAASACVSPCLTLVFCTSNPGPACPALL